MLKYYPGVMSKYKIVILPGDGVGPEIMIQAKKILDLLCEKFNFNLELIERECGFAYMKRTGVPWPEGTFDLCRDSADAILLGAIGRSDNTKPLTIGSVSPGRTIVLGLRKRLELFANVRPIKLFPNVPIKISNKYQNVWSPDNVDLVIVRENTEGLYLSQDTEDLFNSNEQVIDQRLISRSGSLRVIDFAFELATKRAGAPEDGKSRVTCVDKSNVLNGCRLFRNLFNSVSTEYSKIEPDFYYVDAFTLALLQKPERFDVVVTTNMFGDILTDLGSVLQGGVGMAPSANLGTTFGMFEPVHGSAPDIAGKNIANPIGMLLSTQMMLEWLGTKRNDPNLIQSSSTLSQAVNKYLEIGKYLPQDLGGSASTSEVTQRIIEQLKDIK
jgi:3-isopropylmalate dehydrogenase